MPPREPVTAGTIEMEAPVAAQAKAQARPADEAFKLPAVQETMDALEGQDFMDRLWVKDASLWKGETAAIHNRLGWLTSPTIMRGHADDIKRFADEIRRLQFTHVVLLGMGGSSLCGDVFNLTFGSKMGYPDLLLLDSTDPAAIKQTLDRLNLTRTLFIVATKSGTTTETLSLYQYFRGQVEASSVPRAGIHFVAFTDPGRPLDKLATESGFRRTFLNPASIGRRYSALSFFGLVLMTNSGKKPAGVSQGLQAFLGQAVRATTSPSRRTWRPRRTRGADCRNSGRSCATASSSRPRWHSARATCTRRGNCTRAVAPTASSFRSRARTRRTWPSRARGTASRRSKPPRPWATSRPCGTRDAGWCACI